MNNIGTELYSRQLIAQLTSDILIDKLNNESITFYIGFDMTARSLHLGHVLLLKIIERLVKNGHKAIILLGGFTSIIGDPTGKTKERSVLEEEEVEENKKFISQQIYRILGNQDNITIVNNHDWLSQLSYESFLKEYGKYCSVNQMIKMETASERLHQQLHLSLLEFNYMVLQGIDFYHLYKKYNCILQIGGSDQWGNILMGIDLVQKKSWDTVMGMTVPLLTTANGKKMGKTEDGALWLDKDLCQPYTMWQYLRNLPDDDILPLLLKLTDLSLEEIQQLSIKNNINDLKIILADKLVQWIHGNDIFQNVQKEIQRKFHKNNSEIFDLEEIKQDPNNIPFETNNLNNFTLEELMMLTFEKIISSKSEAKRKISEKCVRINDQLITEFYQKLTLSHFINGVLCLEIGKNHRKYIFLK